MLAGEDGVQVSTEYEKAETEEIKALIRRSIIKHKRPSDRKHSNIHSQVKSLPQTCFIFVHSSKNGQNLVYILNQVHKGSHFSSARFSHNQY